MSAPDQTLDVPQTKAERKQQKAAAKALKKETNRLLDQLHEQGNQAVYNTGKAISGALAYDRTLSQLSTRRPEVGKVALPAEIVDLLYQAEKLLDEHTRKLLTQTDAQLFPGRAERLQAEADANNQDSRTATMEKYAGYSGG